MKDLTDPTRPSAAVTTPSTPSSPRPAPASEQAEAKHNWESFVLYFHIYIR
jgi:hypothetical protein